MDYMSHFNMSICCKTSIQVSKRNPLYFLSTHHDTHKFSNREIRTFASLEKILEKNPIYNQQTYHRVLYVSYLQHNSKNVIASQKGSSLKVHKFHLVNGSICHPVQLVAGQIIWQSSVWSTQESINGKKSINFTQNMGFMVFKPSCNSLALPSNECWDSSELESRINPPWMARISPCRSVSDIGSK